MTDRNVLECKAIDKFSVIDKFATVKELLGVLDKGAHLARSRYLSDTDLAALAKNCLPVAQLT